MMMAKISTVSILGVTNASIATHVLMRNEPLAIESYIEA